MTNESRNFKALKEGRCPNCNELHSGWQFYDLSKKQLTLYNHAVTHSCGFIYAIDNNNKIAVVITR